MHTRVHLEHDRALATLGRFEEAVRVLKAGEAKWAPSQAPFMDQTISQAELDHSPQMPRASESWKLLRGRLERRMGDRRADRAIVCRRTRLDLAMFWLLCAVGAEGEPAELEDALRNLSETLEETLDATIDGPLLSSDGPGLYVKEDAAWISTRTLPKLLVALGLAARFGALGGLGAVVELMHKAAPTVSHFSKLKANVVRLLHATGKLHDIQNGAERRQVVRDHPELLTPLHASLLAEDTIKGMRLRVPGAGQDALSAVGVTRAEQAATGLVDRLQRV